MTCKLCDGSGVLYDPDDISKESKCPDCNGNGHVKRFLVEHLLGYPDVEKYLDREPNPEYRLVSVLRTKHETHILYWERRDDK